MKVTKMETGKFQKLPYRVNSKNLYRGIIFRLIGKKYKNTVREVSLNVKLSLKRFINTKRTHCFRREMISS